MAYFNKDTYERKNEWAAKHNAEQSNIAKQNGMTEEQTEAMERLCRDRHYLHTHTDSLFYIETFDHDVIQKMLDSDCEYEDSIKNYLEKAGLKNSLDFQTNLIPDSQTYDDDMTFDDDDAREDARCAALNEVSTFMDEVNEKIEQFMRAIDEKYGTQYCPTGIARSHI